ncbi:MAG: NirD/YgiW/YdeI family stress tolerance protein [Treponema sp.]|jgi:uncharacterized protein (TIGR00156 family)|nr:NirD/YgiW/YdeI family stress tolerance protein [Treponema sp.]
MRKYTLFFVCCSISLIAAAGVFAQQGAAGQFGPGTGFTGPGSSGQFGYGFTGPSQTVTVAQAQAYGHKTPVIIKGNIVQALGGDLYTFRDSSGDIVLRIGRKEWQYYGTTISPSDTIEISGEVHRKYWQQPEVHARFIRKI